MHSNLGDRVRGNLLSQGILNNSESIEYGQGVRLETYRGALIIRHGGVSWGFRAQLVRFVDQQFSIAVLCNADSLNAKSLAFQVADYYLGESLDRTDGASLLRPETEETSKDDVREFIDYSADDLEAYTGRYYAPALESFIK